MRNLCNNRRCPQLLVCDAFCGFCWFAETSNYDQPKISANQTMESFSVRLLLRIILSFDRWYDRKSTNMTCLTANWNWSALLMNYFPLLDNENFILIRRWSKLFSVFFDSVFSKRNTMHVLCVSIKLQKHMGELENALEKLACRLVLPQPVTFSQTSSHSCFRLLFLWKKFVQ